MEGFCRGPITFGGATNSILNYAKITQDNPNSYVIRTDGIGTTTVTNDGWIKGSVLDTATGAIAGVEAGRLPAEDNPSRAIFLVPSAIQVMNQSGDVFNSGQLLDVSHFINHGSLSVGSMGFVGTTRITDNLTQHDGGMLAVDLNSTGGDSPANRVNIDGPRRSGRAGRHQRAQYLEADSRGTVGAHPHGRRRPSRCQPGTDPLRGRPYRLEQQTPAALLSCAERTGGYRFFDQRQCGWLRLRGQHFQQQGTSENLGFDEDSWQLAGGGHLDIGNG